MNQHPSWPFDMNSKNTTNNTEGRGRGGANRAQDHDGFDSYYWPGFDPFSYAAFFPPGGMPHRGRRGPPPPFSAMAPDFMNVNTLNNTATDPMMSMDDFNTSIKPPVFGKIPSVPLKFGEASGTSRARSRSRSGSRSRSRSTHDVPSRTSTPPTPPEKAASDSDSDRTASPSPHRHHHHHHDHHGRHGGGHGRRGGGGHGWRGGRGGRHFGRRTDDNKDPFPFPRMPLQPPPMRFGRHDACEPTVCPFRAADNDEQEVLGARMRPIPGRRGLRGMRGLDRAPLPDADVFDTRDAYVIHVALAGAKKADLDVSFESVRNVVRVSGMLHRPDEVDDKMLDSLVQRERAMGYFEKTIELDREARVDADELVAKLEDGVLRIEIPKLKGDDWTEVRKVVIE